MVKIDEKFSLNGGFYYDLMIVFDVAYFLGPPCICFIILCRNSDISYGACTRLACRQRALQFRAAVWSSMRFFPSTIKARQQILRPKPNWLVTILVMPRARPRVGKTMLFDFEGNGRSCVFFVKSATNHKYVYDFRVSTKFDMQIKCDFHGFISKFCCDHASSRTCFLQHSLPPPICTVYKQPCDGLCAWLIHGACLSVELPSAYVHGPHTIIHTVSQQHYQLRACTTL